jgi:TonB family protein
MFFTIAAGLILALFCLLLMRTTHASRNPQAPEPAEDHSPAYEEGMKALSDANYKKAAELFQKAAADKPDDMWAFYYFGLCLLNLKRFDEAANAYQQAMRIKPDEAAVHYQLGKIHLEKGDPEAAKNELGWLQEHSQNLALYLSDLFPADNTASQPQQETTDPPANSQPPRPADKNMQPTTASQRPTILYREKAKYTEIAKINHVQGAVVLQVVFEVGGVIRLIRVTRKLPDGLTQKAIEAAQKIRFNPATRNGAPVSVRGTLEFQFNLY